MSPIDCTGVGPECSCSVLPSLSVRWTFGSFSAYTVTTLRGVLNPEKADPALGGLSERALGSHSLLFLLLGECAHYHFRDEYRICRLLLAWLSLTLSVILLYLLFHRSRWGK